MVAALCAPYLGLSIRQRTFNTTPSHTTGDGTQDRLLALFLTASSSCIPLSTAGVWDFFRTSWPSAGGDL